MHKLPKYHAQLDLINRIISSKNFWILIIFLFALIFRLFFLDLIETGIDVEHTMTEITEFYNKPYIIQTGMFQSTGMHNFPLFDYLMIIIASVSRNQQYLSFTIALINVYMVIIYFLIVDKFYGRLPAIFSSLLVSLSPWAILFSRKIWEQDLLPLLLIPFLYFFHQLIIAKKRFAAFPMFIFLSLLLQLHGSGLYFTISICLTLFILKITFSKKLAVIGFLVGLLPAIPYIFYQMHSTPFCSDCVAFINYANSYRWFDSSNLLRPFQIIGGSSFGLILGDSYNEFFKSSLIVPISEILFSFECAMIICSSYLIFRYEKKLLFLPLIVLMLSLGYYNTRILAYMHYFIIIIPFVALLLGLFFAQTLQRTKNFFLQSCIMVLFILIILSRLIFEFNFNHFLSVKKVVQGDYGKIYSEMHPVAGH